MATNQHGDAEAAQRQPLRFTRQPKPSSEQGSDAAWVPEDVDNDPVPDDLGDEDQVPVPDDDLSFPDTGDDSHADDDVVDPDILDDDAKAVG